jgi:predicted kinase
MCYKRMMAIKRRRRKKPVRPGEQGEQQAPLQPVYPEARESAEADDAEVPEPAAEVAPENPAANAATQQRSGRKRRRGGRGRNKPGGPIPRIREDAPAAPSDNELDSGPEADLTPAPAKSAAPHTHAPAPHGHKRQPKGTVVLTIGLPGSGKTSWFRRRGITPLSSDLLRMMLFDDIAEQRYQDLVFSTLRYLLRARMIARMPWNYVDATNLSPRERRGWIKMAQEFGYEVQAVFFDVPVEVCTERNQRRGRLVPEDVMQRMAQKLRPPTFDEGFSKITVVRVKKTSKAEPDNEVQAEDEVGDTGESEPDE